MQLLKRENYSILLEHASMPLVNHTITWAPLHLGFRTYVNVQLIRRARHAPRAWNNFSNRTTCLWRSLMCLLLLWDAHCWLVSSEPVLKGIEGGIPQLVLSESCLVSFFNSYVVRRRKKTVYLRFACIQLLLVASAMLLTLVSQFL